MHNVIVSFKAKFDETKHGIDNLAYEELPEEHENSEVHFDRDRSPFCPDYTLEAVSDLKFIKVTTRIVCCLLFSVSKL